MKIEINKNNGIPIYIQIKKQIKMMIDKGILTKGDRLPPERELAEELKVSRNRVSTAYKELEAEKIVSSQQGKGTFIAGKIAGVHEASRKDMLLKIIDLALEESASLGFSFNDFLTIAYVRAKEKEEILSKVKVAFIECNQEQLTALIKDIRLKYNLAIFPILMGELRSDPQRIKRILKKVEIIVTTTFHLKEVEEFIAGMDKQIIAMTLEPQMNTIVELARIKHGNEVGLICQSADFVSEVEKSLSKIGLNNLDFNYTIEKRAELDRFISAHDILITSPSRYKDVLVLADDDKQVIKFNYSPDSGSINMLKMALIDLKEKG